MRVDPPPGRHGQSRLTRRDLLFPGARGDRPRPADSGTRWHIDPTKDAADRPALIVLLLRGGADGLHIVPPYRDDAYHRARPTIRLRPPNDRTVAKTDRCIDLDGAFGIHPALAPLVPLYRDGSLAIVHACGSGDRTRSHFEAMSTVERGLETADRGPRTGWVARYLSATPPATPSPLRAVAFSDVSPESLRGAPDAVVLRNLNEFRLGSLPHSSASEAWRAGLVDLYARAADPVAPAGRAILKAVAAVQRAVAAASSRADRVPYPASGLGAALRETATLLRAGVGLEIAVLERGGWDTHVAQGAGGGWMASLLDDVARSVAAFAADIGSGRSRVRVVALTEFGRRVAENGGYGTDHGRASVALVLGGSVQGGRVVTDWPGLDPEDLEGPGDLRVTADYRSVLYGALRSLGCEGALSSVFPAFRPVVAHSPFLVE